MVLKLSSLCLGVSDSSKVSEKGQKRKKKKTKTETREKTGTPGVIIGLNVPRYQVPTNPNHARVVSNQALA